MAELLIRTVNGENARRYMEGDVVAVCEDGHAFGRMESLETWAAEGRDPDRWPGGFAIVRLPGMSVDDARQYLEEVHILGLPANGLSARRAYTVNYAALERRAAEDGRDTLRTQKQITRHPGDPDVKAAFSRKG
ncbi:MAG: hypothetical protein J0H10_15325 [Alphaproteobacteria bacterium]|nr:hypothetical protein [Alphaproteobacteria bacterium]